MTALNLIAAVPTPPQMEMPETAQALFTIWLGLPLAAMLYIAIRKIQSGEGPLMLYCIIGGAFASLWEATVNVLGTMSYAEDGIWTAYTMYDRKIPVLIPLAYSWFVGGQAYIIFRLFQRGVSRRRVFEIWGVLFLINIVIETPGLLANAYEYYGNQPWDFWGFPFWYGWANPMAPIIAAAAIYKLWPHIQRGVARLAVIPIVFMSFGIGYAAISLPLWATLNDTDLGYGFTYAASLVTLGLALLVLWLVSIVVARPELERSPPSADAEEPARREPVAV
jgi:hypothetical protein